MSEFDQSWDRLVRKARNTGSYEEPVAIPPGFAARVIAGPALSMRPESHGWENMATRSLLAACTVAAVSAALMWSSFTSESEGSDLAELADPLAEVALLE